jgi:hypothetical protein
VLDFLSLFIFKMNPQDLSWSCKVLADFCCFFHIDLTGYKSSVPQFLSYKPLWVLGIHSSLYHSSSIRLDWMDFLLARFFKRDSWDPLFSNSFMFENVCYLYKFDIHLLVCDCNLLEGVVYLNNSFIVIGFQWCKKVMSRTGSVDECWTLA